MADILPEYTYTIEEFISSEQNTQISYDTLCIFEKVNDIYLITHNIINDYIKEIKSASITIEFSDLEYNKYIYKPKLLAYDLYGSTELYFVILKMNGMYDEKQFSKRTIKLIKSAKLRDILSFIYQSENSILQTNRSKIT